MEHRKPENQSLDAKYESLLAMKNSVITRKQMRGFACLSMKRRKEISAMGGKTLARKRGKKHMAKLGRKGGRAIHVHRGPRKLRKAA